VGGRVLVRLLIHAFNIHQGGGATLLAGLLQKIPSNINVVVSVDSRMQIPDGIPECVSFEYVKPTFFGRLLAEYRLACISREGDQVLCFGNLPPLFKVKGFVSVFIQNRYLVDKKRLLMRLSPMLAFRLLAERIWLKQFKKRANRFFVQTSTMKKLTERQLQVNAVLAPFAPASLTNFASSDIKSQSPRFDFLYVASGEAHKNHKILVAAWSSLAIEGLFPTLALTLDPIDSAELVEHIDGECKFHKLNINNLGRLQRHKLTELYRECGALIYASDFESFGLPIVEARIAGLAILAPELDYVRDLLDPEETFDPSSAISISRAIKRYLKVNVASFKTITADDFLGKVMEFE
jgi:glycosyltransferase involved in cell wall biosynthesis